MKKNWPLGNSIRCINNKLFNMNVGNNPIETVTNTLSEKFWGSYQKGKIDLEEGAQQVTETHASQFFQTLKKKPRYITLVYSFSNLRARPLVNEMHTYVLESIKYFLIKLDMKPCLHLVEISIFSLNLVIVRLTKIMNRADINWAQF
mgnify:CR=1 FL=1